MLTEPPQGRIRPPQLDIRRLALRSTRLAQALGRLTTPPTTPAASLAPFSRRSTTGADSRPGSLISESKNVSSSSCDFAESLYRQTVGDKVTINLTAAQDR